MRWWWLCLAACNQVYGLDDTRRADAQQFDAPVDAPFACPPIDMTPQFSLVLHRQIDQDCSGYMISAQGRALARCVVDGKVAIYEGLADGPLSLAAGFPVGAPEFDIGVPRLSPEGDRAVIATFDLVATTSEQRVYTRTGGTWMRAANLPFITFGTTSAPTYRPSHIIARPSPTSDLEEWAESSSGTWTRVGTIALSTLGAQTVNGLWLAGDGLRLIVHVDGTSMFAGRLLYLDRPTIDGGFRPPSPLVAPIGSDMFVTADCSRYYVAGLRSIFWVQRE